MYQTPPKEEELIKNSQKNFFKKTKKNLKIINNFKSIKTFQINSIIIK